MKIKSRLPMLFGLLLIVLEMSLWTLYYFTFTLGITQIILLIVCILALIFALMSFKTVKMTAKAFKEEKWKPWTTVLLTTIFFTYLLAKTLVKKGGAPLMLVCNVILIASGILLVIIGATVRIIDEKIDYKDVRRK